MTDVAPRIPWEDVRDPLAGLEQELADFARLHLRRLGCLEVLHLLGRGVHRLTHASLASRTARSVGEARRDLELLADSGLLVKARGPSYVLTPEPGARRRLRALLRRADEDYQVRLALTAFALARETESLEEELATRRVAERAKGLLMQRRGLTEDEAQLFLLKLSRDTRQPLRQAAEQVLRELGPDYA